MAPPRVSAVLIVRDEEAVLADCLASLEGLADEIVVVDTGSTDASMEIARGFGARLGHHEWTGDFAAARNAAIERATGEWILSMDADERVESFDGSLLGLVLGSDDAVAGLVTLRPAAHTTSYRELRLFRNHPAIRFEGRFHEDLVPSIQRVLASDGGRVYDVDVAIGHLGYEGDPTAKHERDLPLLRAHLAADPDQAYSWRHLGVILATRGDADGAEAAWRRAIEIGERDPTQDRWLPWADLIVARRSRGEPVDDLLAAATARYGDIPPLRTLRADAAMVRGEWSAAAADLEALVAGGVPEITDVAVDRRMFAEHSWLRLGICRSQLGDAAGAASAFRRAVELDPASAEARARLAVAEAAARSAG